MDMKHVKYLALVLCIGNLSPVMAQTASKSLTSRQFSCLAAVSAGKLFLIMESGWHARWNLGKEMLW